jgi:hypothetical protein
MHVHLRDTQTGLYYAGPQHWTDQAKDAIDFEHVDRAIKANREQGLADVEVVLSFEDGGDDPSLSLPSGD